MFYKVCKFVKFLQIRQCIWRDSQEVAASYLAGWDGLAGRAELAGRAWLAAWPGWHGLGWVVGRAGPAELSGLYKTRTSLKIFEQNFAKTVKKPLHLPNSNSFIFW